MLLMQQSAAAVTERFIKSGLSGALKRGAQGPVSLGEVVDQTYLPAQNVLDTTAAGDSFNGTYLAAKFSGASQADALAKGHDCARHVVQHRGAIAPLV